MSTLKIGQQSHVLFILEENLLQSLVSSDKIQEAAWCSVFLTEKKRSIAKKLQKRNLFICKTSIWLFRVIKVILRNWESVLRAYTWGIHILVEVLVTLRCEVLLRWRRREVWGSRLWIWLAEHRWWRISVQRSTLSVYRKNMELGQVEIRNGKRKTQHFVACGLNTL